MRLQGSQTRLGGDISRVKRESAGDGRKRKSVGRLARAQASKQLGLSAEEGSDNANAACVRACVRACACERAALVARVVGRRRETSSAREAQSLTASPCPRPCGLLLLLLLLLVARVWRALSVVAVVTLTEEPEYAMRSVHWARTRTRDRDGYRSTW